MTNFFYRGRSTSGDTVEGTLDAQSKTAVLSALKRQNIIPILIEPAKKGMSGGKTKQASPFASLGKLFTKKTVGIDELIMFSRQMYALTRSGIPLIRAINGLADASRSDLLGEILHDISRTLTQGSTLSNAFRTHPDVFGELFVSMIAMGESTGRLDTAFLQLISHLELEKDTRKKIKSATRYPMIVSIAMGLALVIINVMVVPAFSTIFEKLGADLPVPTIILIATSNFMLNFWWLIAIIIIVSVTLTIRWKKTPNGRLKWDELSLRVPVLGGVFERIALGRFARPLAMMLDAGVPLLQALKVSSRTVGNEYIGQGIEGMLNGIERGESLLATASSSGLFNPLILQMIAVGEETGNVSDLLTDISDFYDQEVEYDLKRLAESLEPILLVFMGIMVLVLALGVFLPMWELGAAFG
jgi:MSHA biogenesis protein MshG